jgi:hypothetical protein
MEPDEKLDAAIKRTSEALGRLTDTETGADVLIEVHDVCAGLESIQEALGVESLTTRQLRRKLEKRGLRRE